MTRTRTKALVWGAAVLIVALAASLARQQGLVDGEAMTRVLLGVTGLTVAWFGNRMPKRLAPSRHAHQTARVGGWSMALSGLLYAILWAVAPFEVALIGGCVAVATGIAVTLGYCLWTREKAPAA